VAALCARQVGSLLICSGTWRLRKHCNSPSYPWPLRVFDHRPNTYSISRTDSAAQAEAPENMHMNNSNDEPISSVQQGFNQSSARVADMTICDRWKLVDRVTSLPSFACSHHDRIVSLSKASSNTVLDLSALMLCDCERIEIRDLKLHHRCRIIKNALRVYLCLRWTSHELSSGCGRRPAGHVRPSEGSPCIR